MNGVSWRFIKSTIVVTILIYTVFSMYPMFHMNDQKPSFGNGHLVNTEGLSILHRQMRMRYFGYLYNILQFFPKDLIYLIIDYHNPEPDDVHYNFEKPECVQKKRAHLSTISNILALKQGGCATVAQYDGHLKIWSFSLHNFGVSYGLDLTNDINTGMYQIHSLAQLKNESVVVGGCTQKNNDEYYKTMQIWDLKNKALTYQNDAEEGDILCIAVLYKNNHELIASGCSDGTLAIRDFTTNLARILKLNGSSITALVALANGYLLSASGNGKIRLWDFNKQNRFLLSEYNINTGFEVFLFSKQLLHEPFSLVQLNDKIVAFASRINDCNESFIGFIHFGDQGNSIKGIHFFKPTTCSTFGYFQLCKSTLNQYLMAVAPHMIKLFNDIHLANGPQYLTQWDFKGAHFSVAAMLKKDFLIVGSYQGELLVFGSVKKDPKQIMQ